VYALGEAAAGELIVLGLDGDPDFDGTCTNGKLEILDASGETRIVVNDGGATSNARG
jgi:hypothetical protein